VTFEVAAEFYDRFMGRYSSQLAPAFLDLTGISAGERALDVGCGPGALTAELVRRLGAEAVAAVDPSHGFVAAARERFPDVDVRESAAEALPHDDGSFDATFAQLVVHFMRDPVEGLREMARVTRPGGVVAASVWDAAGERAPISTFWRAARELDPEVGGEMSRAGAREGHLTELFEAAGLVDVEQTALSASVDYATFDEWWQPYTFGVGPAGTYAATIEEAHRDAVRDRCRDLMGDPPFTVTAFAWAARARSPGPS
jgi:ubiquinone/menaquinone biosynthesis C-methylase UbiE